MLQADNPSSEHQRYDSEKSESTYFKEVKEFDENIESTSYETEAETPNAKIEINKEKYTCSKPKRETIIAKIIHD